MSVSLSADLVINGISLCFLGGATDNRKRFSFHSTNGFIHLVFKNGGEGEGGHLGSENSPPHHFPACRRTPYYDNGVE